MKVDKDKVCQSILGYRDTALLGYIFAENTEFTSEKLALLKRYWPVESQELFKLSHYIQYQIGNVMSWLQLQGRYESGKPYINVHIDKPGMLKNYILGLTERNRLIWKDENMEEILSFAQGKKVLDYGYGGGFYADYFCKIAEEVCGIEQHDVADYVNNYIILPDKFKDITLDDKNYKQYFDVIFISEVLHGDSPEEIMGMMEYIKPMLKPGGMLVVNELWQDTVLGKLFDIQMKLHTKGGRLYSPEELGHIIGYPKGFVTERGFKYHFMLKGVL